MINMTWFEVIAKRISIPYMAYIDYIMQQHVREPRNVNQILDLMFDDSKIEEYKNNYSKIKPSKELEYRLKNQSEPLWGWEESWPPAKKIGELNIKMVSVQRRNLPSRKELESYLKKYYSSGDKDTLTGELKYWSA